MAKYKQSNVPISLELELHEQSVNIDVESMAPVDPAFTAKSFDVANSTIVAIVNNTTGQSKTYRLAVRANLEAGASAWTQVISGDDKSFKNKVKFERIVEANAGIVEPILFRAGLTLDETKPRAKQLTELAKQFKIADITVPAGMQVLRIHLSQRLLPIDASAKSYHLDAYLPLMSFAPTSTVMLAATLVFPRGSMQKADITEARHLPIPGLPTPQLVAGGDNPLMLANQQCYAWEFHNVDPMLSISWTYK